MGNLGEILISAGHKYREGRVRLSPVKVIPLSFIAAIIVGTFLLMLPVCSASGESTDLLTALFTATTAVSVTGLVVVDTYAHWSLVGKIIILILIQLGGLGIVSFSSMIMIFLHKKISLQDRKILFDALNLDSGKGVLGFLTGVFKWTFIVEGLGAVGYMFSFIPRFGIVNGIWYSVFTAISAFCNAGIDILGPDSLISFNDSPWILINTMIMIVLGGLGYVVWFDITAKVKEGVSSKQTPVRIFKRFGEHTRLVLILTVALIIAGTLVILPAEYNNSDTMADMTVGRKIINSLFQSVTYRTAGFAAVPQDGLSTVSVMVGYFLMLIGGSPIGTAGGIKTVTMFIVVMNVVSFINGRNETVIFKRRLTEDMMRKAAAIVSVSFAVTIFMTVLLLATNPVGIEDALFEVVSAIATVGLSRNLTSSLNVWGRLIIIVCMYLGRIGPISLAIFFTRQGSGKNRLEYAEGKFYVG